MITERRRASRRNAFKTGFLTDAQRQQFLECLIWNLNSYGAMIEIEPGTEIDTFGRLISEPLDLDREYGSIWRDGRIIGVEFKN